MQVSKIKVKVAQELSAIVNYCWAVAFPGFQRAKRAAVCYHMYSLNENKASRIATNNPSAMDELTAFQMIRVYPKPTRTDSSNYMPHPHWAHGVQIVALNFQSIDSVAMQLNQSKFLTNGRTGYVRKPPITASGAVALEVVVRGAMHLGGGNTKPAVLLQLFGTVRVFQQEFALEDAIGSHAARFKLLHACGQWHSSRVSTVLTGSHCKLRSTTLKARMGMLWTSKPNLAKTRMILCGPSTMCFVWIMCNSRDTQSCILKPSHHPEHHSGMHAYHFHRYVPATE
jgi:hypothetical protein